MSYDGGSLSYFAFNTQKSPADNEDLRKAVAYGIDVDSIIAVAAEGRGKKATSFWGWNEYGFYDCGGYEYNPDKAKRVSGKGISNGGATLDVTVSGAERKTIAEMIQSQLKEIGIAINIVELDSAGLSTSTKGDHQSCIYGMGFNIFGDDARRILQPGSAVNKAHYDDPEVMELLIRLLQKQMRQREKSIIKRFRKMFMSMFRIFTLLCRWFYRCEKGTGGIDIYPTSHHDYSKVFVPAD
ncbi:MAG: ABC transporter substrate-binding protein [Pilosibacter sp.]